MAAGRGGVTALEVGYQRAMGTDRATLLARRVPPEDVIVGRVYIIHARNGGVGVAVRADDGVLGYCLHREKFGRHFLFVEADWDNPTYYGTAIPLRLLPDLPPQDEEALLAWLADREAEHRVEIREAWREVIGDHVDRTR